MDVKLWRCRDAYITMKAIDDSVVTAIFTAASYTYGPLLGLFAFGILTKYKVNDNLVPYFCILSPIILFVLNTYVIVPHTAYRVGFELIVYNALITFLMLLFTAPGKLEKGAKEATL